MPSPSPSAVARFSLGLVPLTSDAKVLALWKPTSESTDRSYQVTGDANDPTIFLGHDFAVSPLQLSLECDDTCWITTVGFVKLPTDTPPWPEPEPHTQKGPCGGAGSFLLTADIPAEGAKVVEVQDLGYSARYGYRLVVGTKDGQGGSYSFDPRVYNHGIIGKPWWRRFWQALRRLLQLDP